MTDQMPCPRDGTKLTLRANSKATYWSCECCHGVLLERRLLESDDLGRRMKEVLGRPTVTTSAMDGTVTYPGTDRQMKPVQHGDVTIDVCQKTGDVWLDGGEIDKILAARPPKREKSQSSVDYDISTGTDSGESLIDAVGDFLDVVGDFVVIDF